MSIPDHIAALANINLEQHLDSMEKLPADLQKNFAQMRNLDNKTKKVAQKVDNDSDNVLEIIRSGLVSQKKQKEEISKIEKLYGKLRAILDEKVSLAVQTYELVDKHIRHLDADLSRFEAECRESEQKAAGAAAKKQARAKSSGSAALKKAVARRGRKRKANAKVEVPKEPPKPFRKIPAAVAAAAALAISSPTSESDSCVTYAPESTEVFDMPVDPNEPTYCLCQQVSFGEMVCCDNPDCSIEWFHFPCVNLIAKPKGKWYCPKCLEERKKRK